MVIILKNYIHFCIISQRMPHGLCYKPSYHIKYSVIRCHLLTWMREEIGTSMKTVSVSLCTKTVCLLCAVCSDRVQSLCYLQLPRQLVSCSSDGGIAVWNMDVSREEVRGQSRTCWGWEALVSLAVSRPCSHSCTCHGCPSRPACHFIHIISPPELLPMKAPWACRWHLNCFSALIGALVPWDLGCVEGSGGIYVPTVLPSQSLRVHQDVSDIARLLLFWENCSVSLLLFFT